MPQSQQPTAATNRMQPFQIAQGEAEKPVTGTTTETRAEGGEAKHSAGEIPSPTLLFWNSVLVALAMIAFALVARRRLSDVPKGIGNLAEWLVESLNRFTVGIIGEGGEKYTPLVGTVFLYVVLSNWLGLFPSLHSPTSNLSLTLALGVIVFVYVQIEGIRNNGPVNYVKHFMGPMPALSPLMLPVELISEFVKPFTLAVRLFGNIFGEDVIIIVLAGLGATLGGSALGWLPLHLPLMFLAWLTSLVQAMVFSILTCIYLSLMAHHDHSEHGEEGAVDAAHSHAAGH